MYIYKITNLCNGMVYIGQTSVSVKKRFLQHCHRRKNPNSYIDRAIQKYGKENFTVELIDSATSADELNEKEIYWIKQYDCVFPKGYNLTFGGSGMLAAGVTKEKMRQAKLGKPSGRKRIPLTAAHRAALSKGHADFHGEKSPSYGKPLSAETKAKISQSLKGRFVGEKNPSFGHKKTPEEIERWRKSRAGYSPSPELRQKISVANKGKRNVAVQCVETGECFDSVEIAAKSVGISKSGITACCRGYQKTAAGFHWKYKRDIKDTVE